MHFTSARLQPTSRYIRQILRGPLSVHVLYAVKSGLRQIRTNYFVPSVNRTKSMANPDTFVGPFKQKKTLFLIRQIWTTTKDLPY